MINGEFTCLYTDSCKLLKYPKYYNSYLERRKHLLASVRSLPCNSDSDIEFGFSTPSKNLLMDNHDTPCNPLTSGAS